MPKSRPMKDKLRKPKGKQPFPATMGTLASKTYLDDPTTTDNPRYSYSIIKEGSLAKRGRGGAKGRRMSNSRKPKKGGY